MLHEDGRRQGGDKMVKEVRLAFKQFRSLLLHDSFQRLSIGSGNTIPGLRLTPEATNIVCTCMTVLC